MMSMIFGSVMSAGLAPYVIITMLKDMGGTVAQMALVPLFAQSCACASLPAALLLRRMNPKHAALTLFCAGRAVFALLLAAPLLRFSPAAVLGVYAAGTVVGGSGMGPANCWLKAVVPETVRGGFFGERNALGLVVAALLTPVAGFVISRAGEDTQRAFFYPALMFIPLLCGFLDLRCLGKVSGADACRKSSGGGEDSVFKSVMSAGVWRAAFIPFVSNAGAAWLGPFAVILCYDIGMSGFGVGIVTAVSSVGGAAGMVLGGRLSDRPGNWMGRIFILFPAAHALCVCILAVLTAFFFSGHFAEKPAAALAGACLSLMSFAGGMAQGAQTKFSLEAVSGGSVPFSAVIFLQSVLTLALLGASVKTGSWAASGVFSGDFHYTQIIFACSAVTGAVSALWLSRMARGGKL
jgi:hypothetical protein